jgi:lipopolysaccharide export system permease protein
MRRFTTILNSYIARELVSPFFLGLSIFTFILLMDQLVRLTRLVLRNGLPFTMIGSMVIYALLQVMALAIPMAVLIACIIAFGRMSSDGELTAIRASGISIFSVARPAILIALVLSITMFFFNNTILPETNYRLRLMQGEILSRNATLAIEPNVYIKLEGFVLICRSKNDKTGELYNVVLYMMETDKEKKREMEITAASGTINYDEDGLKAVLILKDGQIHNIEKVPRKENTYTLINFSQLNKVIIFNDHQDITAKSKSAKEKSIWQLMEDIHPNVNIKGYETSGERLKQPIIIRLRYEMHTRFALPFGCLAFAFIGIPMGFHSRRSGKSIGFGLSLVPIFIYFIGMKLGDAIGITGVIHPGLAAWLPNIIVTALGIGLLVYNNSRK